MRLRSTSSRAWSRGSKGETPSSSDWRKSPVESDRTAPRIPRTRLHRLAPRSRDGAHDELEGQSLGQEGAAAAGRLAGRGKSGDVRRLPTLQVGCDAQDRDADQHDDPDHDPALGDAELEGRHREPGHQDDEPDHVEYQGHSRLLAPEWTWGANAPWRARTPPVIPGARAVPAALAALYLRPRRPPDPASFAFRPDRSKASATIRACSFSWLVRCPSAGLARSGRPM